ncbi:MAG TPA: DUF4412 domain-containing protein [Opitutaceae bacterium]
MKLIPTLVPLCALLVLPGALKAETFEGKVSMKISSSSKKGDGQVINYSLKDGKMRVDVDAAKGVAAMIMDMKNRQMIILMPQQKMYMVRDIPETPRPTPGGSPHGGVSSFTDTGEKETILGYSCSKYIATTSKGTTDIWMTDQLGSFFGLYQGGGPGGRQQAPQEWEALLKGHSMFPLRVVGYEDGKEKFRLEVTAVDKGSLPDSLFTPPDGWRKFDLGNLMGGGGFPGARPSDGNN